MTDVIIIAVCGVLFILLSVVLVWWLKRGKQRFIEKRCPEKLENSKSVVDTNSVRLFGTAHTGRCGQFDIETAKNNDEKE